MSGGSFNYLYSTMSNQLFDYAISGHYSDIDNKENIRIARKINPMRDRELSELLYDVTCLLHALEWYESADIGEDSYKEYVNQFKTKWLNRSDADRVNSYKEDLKDYYEELIAEMEVKKCTMDE